MNQFPLETNIEIFKMLNFKEQVRLRLISKNFKTVFETIWSDNICQYYFMKKPIFIFCHGKTGTGKSYLGQKLFKNFSYYWGPYDNKIKNCLKKDNQQVFPEILCGQRITKRYFNKYKDINFVYLESWGPISDYPTFFLDNINFIIKCEGDYKIKPFVLKYHFERGNEKELSLLINKELS
jgi:hypothetical protein